MNDKLLQSAADCGIIDLAHIQEQLEMKRREELLSMHPYKIWQADNGLWNTYLPNESGRVRKRSKDKRIIENLIIEYWEQESKNPTFADVFNDWNDRRLSLNKICINTHERNKQTFNRHFDEIKKDKIKDWTVLMFSDFLEEQIGRFDLTSKAFSNLKTICRGFLLRAKKEGIIEWDVVNLFNSMDVSDHDFKKTIKEDYEEVFNVDETNRIISYLTENLDSKNIAILLMFITGIRVGELVCLKHSDFDEYLFKIRRTETREKRESNGYDYVVKEYPKTPAGIRTMIIPKNYWWICSKIQSLNYNGEYVFVNENGERITTNCIRRRLERICKKLNIYKKSPHKIRKTYGTILMDNNVDQNMITSLMGHSDITVSEKYYHRDRKDIDKKLEIISEIPEFATPVATLNV